MVQTNNLGYPRIGRNRELKRATERYWAGKTDADELAAAAAAIRAENWRKQFDAGIELIPSNDFSLYDQMLDTIALVGAVPQRYGWDGGTVDLDTYFAMARGSQDVTALEMTKWFDTNYHYLVPELGRDTTFHLSSTKPFDEFTEALSLGFQTKPVLIGPVSFLLLAKSREADVDPLDLLDRLLPVYREVIAGLAERGAFWIQLDEPCCVMDISDRTRQALADAYRDLAAVRGPANLIVQTYFSHVEGNYRTLMDLPVQGIGLDFVRDGQQNLALLEREGFPEDRVLAAGLVNGRNVWISDLEDLLEVVGRITSAVPSARLLINPSCNLMHVPLDVRMEEGVLDPVLMEWLAFAEQKLWEVSALATAVKEGTESIATTLETNAAALARRRGSADVHRQQVQERMAAVDGELSSRGVSFAERSAVQHRSLSLPAYPTTTIGSFPQTPEVRRNRNRLQKGEITQQEHDRFVEEEIRKLIALQEEMGIDVLVHGEFERSDMVEYFGERMEGFAFTRHGWVQSYGSRYTRPPIIYGDVSRPEAMTVRWSTYAQSLTNRPVKGMLTGPVTILNWSFVRDDQPRSDTCLQIALAIRDEVRDLESVGIRVIQVDEPALREGLPLRRSEWQRYLDWAVRCFRVATGVAGPETQIHTHMCYSEFNDIIDSIAALDADVLSIENSRSNSELLEVFRHHGYGQEIGPGVYDIHSPRVPSEEEMRRNLEAASEVLRPEQLWVNPDCGLKTRRWEEVVPALRNMVEAAREMRGAGVAAGSSSSTAP
jgi:5-methyltetrahydropteroyltriglutamate--homocysteine methyltransferase